MKGLKRKIFLTCAHTSNRLRHFNIRIILPATNPGSVKALSKAKLWDYSGQTSQKRHLRKTFAISESVCLWGAVPGIWLTISFPKWNSQKGSRLYNRDKRRKINYCHLSRNITHQCLISREYSWKMALDREPTLTQGNIQWTPFHLLQKGEILKRYTCESKALRVMITPSRDVRIVFGLSIFFQSLSSRNAFPRNHTVLRKCGIHKCFPQRLLNFPLGETWDS